MADGKSKQLFQNIVNHVASLKSLRENEVIDQLGDSESTTRFILNPFSVSSPIFLDFKKHENYSVVNHTLEYVLHIFNLFRKHRKKNEVRKVSHNRKKPEEDDHKRKRHTNPKFKGSCTKINKITDFRKI